MEIDHSNFACNVQKSKKKKARQKITTARKGSSAASVTGSGASIKVLQLCGKFSMCSMQDELMTEGWDIHRNGPNPPWEMSFKKWSFIDLRCSSEVWWENRVKLHKRELYELNANFQIIMEETFGVETIVHLRRVRY